MAKSQYVTLNHRLVPEQSTHKFFKKTVYIKVAVNQHNENNITCRKSLYI